MQTQPTVSILPPVRTAPDGVTALPLVSVIIPTFNRARQLRTTLAALAEQTYPASGLEIIVVDDGSTDDTHQVACSAPCKHLRYCRQLNRGATLARNLGAGQAAGEFLVFVDDDIELLPDTLAEIIHLLQRPERQVVVGTLLADQANRPPATAPATGGTCRDRVVPFTECLAGLLGVRAADFRALGMFHDPTGGWPNWDDVDFGYRAERSGYRIVRSGRGQAIHHDNFAASLTGRCQRCYQASRSAARLFRTYPDIAPHIPMFRDMSPIQRRDSVGLIARKLLRQAASVRMTVSAMEWIERVLRRIAPRPGLLEPLHRWIVGASIFRGFRRGLDETE